ncbi:MAG TPA: folylpolyglutamate synthase/dihydrofolate synthase family protein [Pyrinomonadaceae bacterium]|nr:folylpolyglutamate synthase/dihydrofolate synthase family protein [Pyrinomonadaceae bacterium]
MKLGLESMTKLLQALGNPQNKYLKVQVAGTNGKGSVCAFLESICLAAGIKTGLTTSPHLISITERVRINGEQITEQRFAELATRVRQAAERLVNDGELETVPTYFEQVTAIALLAFAQAKVKVAVLETGLGGRLDATTAAGAEIAVITRIDYDHQQYLGDTIEQIAGEKAAIIHSGSKVVIGEQTPELMTLLFSRCAEFGITPRTRCDAEIYAIDTKNCSMVMTFRTEDELYFDPDLGLPGRHQIENARIAILASESLRFDLGTDIEPDDVVEGLENARHPGRLEFQGRYLFDGAHNVGGAKALRAFLDEFVDKPITMIFGAMQDKDVAEIGKILFPKADLLILTKPKNSRALGANEIADAASSEIADKPVVLTNSVAEAVGEVEKRSTPDAIILITGSLYLVGEAKKLLEERSAAGGGL